MVAAAACLSSSRFSAAACRAPARPPYLAASRQRRQACYGITRSSCANGSKAAASRTWAPSRTVLASASSGSSDGNGSAADPPPTPQQAAAIDRLLALSRSLCSRPLTSEEQQRQRILLLLQLGFAEAAIAQHIEGRRGGPYMAWKTVGTVVQLLRCLGFDQKKLDMVLGASGGRGSVFERQPADVEANLRWLQQEFGLDAAGLYQACSKSPQLLVYTQAKLADNWRQIQAEFQIAGAAMSRLAAALRNGFAGFLEFTPQTVMSRMRALQALLGLSNKQVSARFGGLAFMLNVDSRVLEPRFKLLQKLTGAPTPRLAANILAVPGLLSYPEATLQRNYDAIVEAVGSEATARRLLSRCPQILVGAVDRLARNLQTLQQWGCSSTDAAVNVMLGNAKLGYLALEKPAYKQRADYWQEAYGLASAEQAMLQCAQMLHRNLRTVGPRVAFLRSTRPGQPLPHCIAFVRTDAEFCKMQGLQLSEFTAFTREWLEGEGAEVCRHERQPPESKQQPGSAGSLLDLED